MTEIQTHRSKFAVRAANVANEMQPGDETFRVLAITAGDGNGWKFSTAVLQSSLPLWQGIESYIDHAANPPAIRSVRDLAGVCAQPEWDPSQQGISLVISPCGPAAELLREAGRTWLSLADPRPVMGFSADLLFTSAGREVLEIRKIYSLDLVTRPARGGKFLTRHIKGENESMTLSEQNTNLGDEVRAEMAEQNTPQQAVDASQAENLALYRQLLDSTLRSARIPKPLAERIRARFLDQTYGLEELNLEINSARALAAELQSGTVVQGGGEVRQMFDSRDQLQAACDDLLGAPRNPGAEKVSAARLSGIRELYLTLTGDDNLHGGFHPERLRLSTTADFSGLVKNSLNKVVANRWDELGKAGYDWWQRVSTVEHFNTLNQVTGTLVGTVGSLPEVAEGAAYTELLVGDSPETADWKKYGGYIPLTLELIDRDETRKLRAYPRELAAAGLRKISALVAALFTANGGVGPTLADGGALFNNTAVTTAGGHKNLLTGALSAAEWETVCSAVYQQPQLIKNAAGLYGSGPRLAVNPRFALVPRQLQLTAMKILYPTLENAANIYSENQQRGQPGDVITVPEWTDATDWAAVVDPRIAPAIFIGERFGLMPEVFIAGDELSPAVFTNDEHRLKVRHFLAIWVNDFRPLHKSNAA